MTSGFRSYVWDPLLIISQIATMQSIFYLGFGVWLSLVDLVLQEPQSLDHIFSYKNLEFGTGDGRLIAAAYVLNALTGALGLWVVVQRSKQCTDFAASVHLFHLLFCWIYNSQFPVSFTWWLMNVGCVALTTVLGEFLCMKTEMKSIPLLDGKSRADL
ncbi:Protein SYS1-like [Holothuria leucospilota]|uniref:Protein SYS1 homolog n=1 Tax=Holothuria leucospilota TaxID=206669 RepID=A0A9Q1CA52_HOLLE|nr:Protein SYS1-like [Holothuria leucospilota]